MATADRDSETARIYAGATFGGKLARGRRPAILVVDFSRGFTEPEFPLGADLTAAVSACRELLDLARSRGAPVVFTTVAFDPHLRDAGLMVKKTPATAELLVGSAAVEIDPRLGPLPDEPIVVKKGASAFFGTNLATVFGGLGVDTVLLCGATTSGCVRATAIDLFQYGFPTLVPRSCVADRAPEPHEANLFDIGAKYADVVSHAEALEYLGRSSS
jgi:maleamate amidohydrolase